MKIFNLVITTETVENKRRQLLYKKWANIRMESCKKCRAIENMSNRAAVRPVIHSLKELRKNTWDVERVDKAIKWLTDNFEVPND